MQNSKENVVATLQKLRDKYHSQLDARSQAEFDDVLKELKKLDQSEGRNLPLGELALRALRIIDSTVRLVTNLTDLMK
jgi:hypothetical protein